MRPRLIAPLLREVDEANGEVGAILNDLKIEVIFFASVDEIVEHGEACRLEEVRDLAAVSRAASGGLTLRVVTGPNRRVRRADEAESSGEQLHARRGHSMPGRADRACDRPPVLGDQQSKLHFV